MHSDAVFLDALDRLLTPGSYAYVTRWGYDHTPLHASFTWQVQQRKNGRLVLVAQEVKKSLPLIGARAAQLLRYEPSPIITLADYPRLWQQFIQAGWGAYVTDFRDGGVLLRAHRRGGVASCGMDEDALATALLTVGGVEAFLAEAVEYVVHPRRYKKRQSFS